MNDIAIIIPTLDAERGAATGKLALLHAGCDARLIVVNGPARGFTKTVNEGLAQTTAEDVCILNDDVTRFQLGWLVDLKRALYGKDRERHGIAGPSGKSAAVSKAGKPGDKGLQLVDRLSFWCVLLKRAMIDDIGILDERYIHYRSDNEYCIRAKQRGWRTVWVRGVYLEHVHHGSGHRKKWLDHDARAFTKAGLK